MFTLRSADHYLTVTKSSVLTVCLIAQVAEKTNEDFQFSTVHSHNVGLSLLPHAGILKSVFTPQRSTQSRGTLTADPAICPSCTMASGSTAAQVSGVRTVTCGVPPPTTTAKTSVGASVP